MQGVNEAKRPLEDNLDESLSRVLHNAKMQERTVNRKQFQKLCEVYKAISDLVDGTAEVSLHPAFSAGYVTIKTTGIKLNADQVSTLKTTLEACSVYSTESLVNGDLTVGITIPDVFEPIPEN